MNKDQRKEIDKLILSLSAMEMLRPTKDNEFVATHIAAAVASDLKLILRMVHEQFLRYPANLRFSQELFYEDTVYHLEVAIAALDEIQKIEPFTRILQLYDEAMEALRTLQASVH